MLGQQRKGETWRPFKGGIRSIGALLAANCALKVHSFASTGQEGGANDPEGLLLGFEMKAAAKTSYPNDLRPGVIPLRGEAEDLVLSGGHVDAVWWWIWGERESLRVSEVKEIAGILCYLTCFRPPLLSHFTHSKFTPRSPFTSS